MNKVTWPVVALVAVVCAAVAYMAVNHVDVEIILGVIGLGGLFAGGGAVLNILGTIKAHVNGNVKAMTEIMAESNRLLSRSMPVGPTAESSEKV